MMQKGKPVEPEWPEAEVILGNPPFLGASKLRSELGDMYVTNLHALYGASLQLAICVLLFVRKSESRQALDAAIRNVPVCWQRKESEAVQIELC